MRRNPLLGIVRLARGKVDGLAQFGDTPQSFLASLAPLIAFSLVGAGVLAGAAGLGGMLGFLLLLMVAHLAPPVLSHALARYWDREDWWLRYATAYNWVQCALPLAGLPLVIGMQVVALLGVPVGTVVPLGLTLFVGYALWLQWLLARHGLDLSRGRAAVVVALVHLGTYALAFGPIRVFGWLSGAGA